MNEYGVPVTFQVDKPTDFPAFSLTFVGTRKMTYPDSGLSFTGYVFELIEKGHSTEVIWVSGGELYPEPFVVGGKTYLLELKESLVFTRNGTKGRSAKLNENELIVWPEALFESKR